MNRIGRRKRVGTRKARGVTEREKEERGMTKNTVMKSEVAVGVRSLVETAKRTVRGIGRKRGIGAAEIRRERGIRLEKDREIKRAIVRGVARREIGAIETKLETEREEKGRKRERGEKGRGEAAVDLGRKRGNAK